MLKNKEKTTWAYPIARTLACIALIPLLIIGVTQLIVSQDFFEAFLWGIKQFPAALLEYTVILLAASFIYSIFGKLWTAALLPGLFLVLLTLISYYKTAINGIPLLLEDFALTSDFFHIAGFALSRIKLSFCTVSALIVFVLLCVFLFIVDMHMKKVKWLRIAISAVSSAGILIFLFTPLFVNWAASLDGGKLTQEEKIDRYGAALGIYCAYAQDRKDMAVYSSASVGDIQAQIEGLEASEEREELLTPTVIFLMSESFFDVTKLPSVEFSEDPIPVYHSLAAKHTSGDFVSNTYCGGTGYVELEVLTGISSYLLRETDTLTSLTKKDVYKGIPSVTDVFKSYGYRTSYVHSYNSYLYNRREIYSDFGFDDILFEEDFPADSEMSGGYISDMQLSKKIISMYEGNGGAPMFIYAVSMENHQPYKADKFEEKSSVSISSDKLSDFEIDILASYTQGLNDADRALGYLTDYFSSREEPVMIVFFGDHLPNLGVNDTDSVYSLLGYSSTSVTTDWKPEELKKMLSTDYLIWTNYEEIDKDKTESCTLLGLSVIDRLGFKKNDYYSWLKKYVSPAMLLYRPRLYIDAGGKAYSDIPDAFADVIRDYQVAVYDIVYGDRKLFGTRGNGGMK